MWEDIDRQEFKQLIKKENPVIFDIGCNDGCDSMEFLNMFPKAQLYCFEPDRRAISKFKQGLGDRCHLIESAVGNIDGNMLFYESHGNPGGIHTSYGDWDKSGSIKKPKLHLTKYPWCKFENHNIINCCRLDTFVKNSNIEFIDLIWADVQGAEEELICGGMNTLNEKTRLFYTEFCDEEEYSDELSLNKIISCLPQFQVLKVFSANVLMVNKKFI